MGSAPSTPSLPQDWTLPAREGDRLGHSPGLRLCAVFGLFFAPLVVVIARLAYLQLLLAPDYIAYLNRPRFRTEKLDTVRGRILAADGTVLAEDEVLVSLAVHYRWLEEPADEQWLDREARRRLHTAERRDRHRLNQEKLFVLADRDRLWQNLAQVTGQDAAVLRSRAAEIQQRVETIADTVNTRYRTRHDEAETDDPPPSPEAPWWRRGVAVLLDALRAPPEPDETPVLTIAEQEAYHPVVDSVSPRVVALVEGQPDRFPGVKVTVQTRRRYPLGAVACHLIGYIGPVADADLEEQRNQGVATGDLYKPTDRIGRQGLERYYESWLRGRRGEVRLRVDPSGETTEVRRRKPEAGGDIVVSIDLALQRHLERVLAAAVAGREIEDLSAKVAEFTASSATIEPADDSANGAAAIVLDVHTGEVLAAAGVPGFDPNAVVSDDPGAWASLSRHPGRPLFNRVIGSNLPPGSVFKALSAIAFVQSGLVDPNADFYCQGYLHRPDQLRCLIFTRYGYGHGDTTLFGAIKKSCNVYFFHHAERVGPERISRWADALGFGRPTGIDLPGESGGYLPTPDNVEEHEGHPWRRGDTPRLAIGQASLVVTPLQVARLMAAIANGGTLVTPHLLKAATPGPLASGAPSQPPSEPAPARKVEGLIASKLKPIREGLRAVVEEPGGTGHRTVYVEQVPVAGKTGTAETGPGRKPHAWFAGYAPADQPRVAFAIVLEHGGSGGAEAGPVAKALVEKMLKLGYFLPRVSE